MGIGPGSFRVLDHVTLMVVSFGVFLDGGVFCSLIFDSDGLLWLRNAFAY
jgi:hypothetical protein